MLDPHPHAPNLDRPEVGARAGERAGRTPEATPISHAHPYPTPSRRFPSRPGHECRAPESDTPSCSGSWGASRPARAPSPGYTDLKVGERVYSVGAPSGLERTLGEGIISGLRATSEGQFIQMTAPISPGSSGGGLFDSSGNLIGITTFLLKEAQAINFAIAAENIWH